MTIPTLFDWLAYFDFLRGYPATWILLVTGTFVVLFLDWRLALFALIIQYLVSSLLFFDLLSAQLALIKLFTGMFVCLILYWTARQIDDYHASQPKDIRRQEDPIARVQLGPLSLPQDFALRAGSIIVALLLVAVLAGAFSFYLPGLPETVPYINLASLLLMALGMAGLVAGRAPLPAGMAVLTFLTGFELYFAALDQSTRVLAILSAADFMVALVTAFLAQRQATAYSRALHDS
ncbi:MAG: hypothetical protein ACK2UK_07465 [Candidatus Promineifilaceae bacterium]